MAALEWEGQKLDQDKLYDLRVKRRGDEARLILPSASWNTSGKFLLHSLITGRITPVDDIFELLREQGVYDQIVLPDG